MKSAYNQINLFESKDWLDPDLFVRFMFRRDVCRRQLSLVKLLWNKIQIRLIDLAWACKMEYKNEYL